MNTSILNKSTYDYSKITKMILDEWFNYTLINLQENI